MNRKCLTTVRGTARSRLSVVVVAAFVLLQNACVSVSMQRDEVERYLLSQQPAKALEAIENRKVESRNESKHLLEKAMLLRMQGRFEASNAAFEKAKRLIEKLDAISLAEQAAAVSINDSLRSYLPPPFERVLIHCFSAINYLQLQQYNEARVEILQMDELLKQKGEIRLPFGRYLAGLVFEFNQEPDNAMIAYRKAYQAYQSDNSVIPLMLQEDLLRLSDYLGLSEEHNKFAEMFALQDWPRQQQVSQQARAIAFVFNGLIPRKHSLEINVQSPADGQLHRISTPFYEHRAVRIYNAELSSEAISASSQILDELGKHARAALEQEMPAIIARTIARVSIKNEVVDKTRNDSPLLSLALNVATFLSEQADIRAWNTLPQQILVIRLNLPAGSHDLKLDLSGSSYPDTKQSWQQVNINRGEARVFSLHWPESYVTHRRP